jgi:hypothetical protein
MPSISASVGRGGVNRREDVLTIQPLLNSHIRKLTPLMPVPVTGVCDDSTILLIEEFQLRVMKVSKPDGRIDPKGGTLKSLTAGDTAAATGEPVLQGNALPDPAAKVLKEILKSAGISRATVTSVSRTPQDQARVMYENCLLKGAAFNKRMYAAAGDKVVDVFIANNDKPRDEVIELMLDKINEVGAGNVSKHISDTHYTFDVAPSSIPPAKHDDFLKAINGHKAVSKVIPPPTDPAFHIEIPKDSPGF